MNGTPPKHIAFAMIASLIVPLTVAAAEPSAVPVSGSAYPEIPPDAVAGAGPFSIRGYHQHLFPDRQPMSVFHQRLEQLAKLDYNLVVFGLGSPGVSTITMHQDGTITPNGCDTSALRQLVRHAIELGLEPVFEMKFIGKQLPLLRELVKVHPQLVIDAENPATVLNAVYRLPDGRDAYSATALRLVEYLLDLYPPDHSPKYFHFGIDEFDADDMAALAASMDMSPPQCFAHCLNLGTDFVLKRNITPIIWGDVLLSPALAGVDHGITLPGFRRDARHLQEPGGAYHGAYKSQSVHLHTMVNFLRDRDKIIVADWHYQPSSIGEFPSVDYFLDIGFRDVWGCPWFDATNLRQFSRYAASRDCGGMVATAWNRAYSPEGNFGLQTILCNSAAYFHRPSINPPPTAETIYKIVGARGKSLADEKRTGIVVRDDLELTFRAPVGEAITPQNGLLLLSTMRQGAQVIKQTLRFDPATSELHGVVTLPADIPSTDVLQVSFGYTDSANGFLFTKHGRQGLMVVDRPPQLPAADHGVLLLGDFRNLPSSRSKFQFWLGGECAAPMAIVSPRKPSSKPSADALDVEWFDRLWVQPSEHLNQALTRGMRIEIDAKLIGKLPADDWAALLTKGSFSTGFRVLVRKDGRLMLQFANLDHGKPLAVLSASPLPRNEWVRVSLTYSPPNGQMPGEAVIRFNDHVEARRPVLIPMQAANALVGVGCEFTDPESGPIGKRRPNFPGLIRRLEISRLGDSDPL